MTFDLEGQGQGQILKIVFFMNFATACTLGYTKFKCSRTSNLHSVPFALDLDVCNFSFLKGAVHGTGVPACFIPFSRPLQ